MISSPDVLTSSFSFPTTYHVTKLDSSVIYYAVKNKQIYQVHVTMYHRQISYGFDGWFLIKEIPLYMIIHQKYIIDL